MERNRQWDNALPINNRTVFVQGVSNTLYQDIKILSLNVCGLKSKLKIPEFTDMLNLYDIIAIQETKLDDADSVELPGYTIICQNRKKISRYRSGGTAFIYKNSLKHHIVPMKSHSKLIQWIRISKAVTNTDRDIYCGNIYIPPQGSKFASPDPYLEIQTEINEHCENSDLLLIGDFNSRSGVSRDYTITDEFLSKLHDDNILQTESAHILSKLEEYGVPLERRSADSTTNTYGLQLIELCKSNDLFILNGRLGTDRQNPKTTCKDRSTIDYCISNVNLIQRINNFCIQEFSSLYSDSHCGVTLTVKSVYQPSSQAENKPSPNPRLKLWKQENADSFLANFDSHKLSQINIVLNSLKQKQTVSKSDIDNVTCDIEDVFHNACEGAFGMYTPCEKAPTRPNKPWFNTECRLARNSYHKTRRLYNRFKTDHYKYLLKTVSKKYKCVISKNIRRHKDVTIERLRQLKSKDPKEYWRILNGSKPKSENHVSVEDFFKYFENINNPPNHSNAEEIIINTKYENDEINLPIREIEIRQAVKELKRNKSPGIDQILNEHIQITLDMMLPTYTNLFNLIFDNATIPESWLMGEILPIYKNKGDIKNPENYRPITLLSCIGKLFTSIINSRLNNFAEKQDLITNSQTGFRKGFSTADNIFVINSLIEMMKSKSKKLFCVFVDYKQAFDSVWRTGLWQKLQSSNINGKCFRLIQNLYQNIKSRVKSANGVSAFFPCKIGVRQGENLSPFLFSIFLNDLEGHFFKNHVPGVEFEFADNDLVTYIKLFVLLYADDTVMFSETPDDLQRTLNAFNDYCTAWKLNVNVSKTKVMIISRGRQKSDINFYLNGTKLEIVQEYKYLGIYLTKSGSFNTAKKYIAEQANKALFSLIKKSRSLDLSYDLQIDLFNKTVKPILLYCSEIWGTGNCDIIDRIQLKFFKHIFHLKKSTPSFMIYGELGVTPISVDIKAKTISFWSKIVSQHDQPTRLSYQIYTILYNLHKSNQCKSIFIENIESILNSCGFSGIWQTQDVINPKWLSLAIKQKLSDQYNQNWHSLVESSSSGKIYRLFKEKFEQSKYLKILPNSYCKTFIRFRTRNTKIPVEVGRWNGTPFDERICTFCSKDVGDEYHYILSCTHFKETRPNFIKPSYLARPNTQKFKNLMNSENANELRKLCQFITLINDAFD